MKPITYRVMLAFAFAHDCMLATPRKDNGRERYTAIVATSGEHSTHTCDVPIDILACLDDEVPSEVLRHLRDPIYGAGYSIPRGGVRELIIDWLLAQQ